MSLRKIFLDSRGGDRGAVESLIMKFHPLLVKVSYRYGYFDEDCYQECVIAMIKSIDKFKIREF